MTQAENLLREARDFLVGYRRPDLNWRNANELIERIDACLSAAPSGWVKFTEKQPPVDEPVLCWFDSTLPMDVGNWCPEREKLHVTGWQSENGDMQVWDAWPLYWMPLPVPPLAAAGEGK